MPGAAEMPRIGLAEGRLLFCQLLGEGQHGLTHEYYVAA
jgi:hypothetical protein